MRLPILFPEMERVARVEFPYRTKGDSMIGTLKREAGMLGISDFPKANVFSDLALYRKLINHLYGGANNEERSGSWRAMLFQIVMQPFTAASSTKARRTA